MSLFPEKHLFEGLKAKAYDLDIPKIKLSDFRYITENLKYKLFKWQEDALINFLTYEAIKEREEDFAPTHLLFNMATGAGKTLVMAATILYYYKKGYRNFIFFVNQNNIVGKTEENLCNASHNKYLFAQSIVIDDQTVNIKKVNTFADNSDDIQIKFTSIHALHNDVYKVKEDNVFLEDLQRKDIIMLGDEAHHLNAKTIKNKGIQLEILATKELSEGASQDDIEKSWEHTVIELLLNKGSKKGSFANKNALLEFTATVPEDEQVRKKYLSKTIIKFDLKDFLKAGYTKEINLVSSSFDKKKRILQALLFNWYRHKIALKKEISNFKPVILFRSKTVDIAEQNNSKEDFAFFKGLIHDLQSSDFDFLQEIDDAKLMEEVEIYKKGQSRIIDVKRFIAEESSLKEVIDYLQDSFNERNCIITNSKTNKTKKEKTDEETDRLLNSLEDKENHIRAIFTVQRLTEGWDVQNLFDIVRLYEGQNTGGSNKGKSGGATTSEVQLIGRGVRYCPFKYMEKEANKRKFDADLNNELRVLEEFYFHSDNDERYLSELKKELKDKKWITDDKVVKPFGLKKEFLDKYKDYQIFVNTRLDNKDKKQRELPELQKDFEFAYKIENLSINETIIRLEKDEADKIRYDSGNSDFGTIYTKLKDFETHIIRKALNIQARKDNSIFRFSNLKEELEIKSMDDVLKDNFFGSLKIGVLVATSIYSKGNDDKQRLELIPNEQKLKLLVRFFDKLGNELKQISNPYIGSEFSAKNLISLFAEKSKSVLLDEENTKLETDYIAKKWYSSNAFHGTSEEQSLIKFLESIIGNFESQYEEVQLLRNEEVYKIFDFKTGKGFQPDFILLLKQKSQSLYYQVFIEPKGDQFKDEDGLFEKGKEGWKERFLQEITEKHGINRNLKVENNEYKLIGLPLYNKKNSLDFNAKVKEYLATEIA
jgi:type III restriction enzyme